MRWTMSKAFRCDGCDDLHGGQPAAKLKLTAEYGTIGTPLKIGHSVHDDAFPADYPVREVEWPFHRTSVDLCSDCTADHLVPGVLAAVTGGRYDRDE